MKKNKVAIVITTFNRDNMVGDAISSSLKQTYPCEVVVVDHGSSDNTQKVVESYGDKIKYIRREKDLGPFFCWLDGIMNTDAEFIHIQHDDDSIHETFIERCVNLLTDDVGIVIAESGLFKFKKIFKKSGIFKMKKLSKRLIKGEMYSPSSSLLRKQDLIDALYQGGLPFEKFKRYNGVGPDSFFTLLTSLRYKNVGIIVDKLVFFREHEGSITCDAHTDINKYLKIKEAYSNVLEYYMFLRWYKRLRLLRYFNITYLSSYLYHKLGRLYLRIRPSIINKNTGEE